MRLARLALLGLLLLPGVAHAEGMPQLDFANPLTTSQVVWGAIIFALLYFVLSRFALPRVAEVIEQRAQHIAADLETARASANSLLTILNDILDFSKIEAGRLDLNPIPFSLPEALLPVASVPR